MPQSLAKNYVHLIWSTKHRQPFIDENIEERLWNYLGGTCRELECSPVRIGGWYGHVHVLCLLSRKIPLMDLVEKVKANSSSWMKKQGGEYYNFYWQNGYAAFSVSPLGVDDVTEYIADLLAQVYNLSRFARTLVPDSVRFQNYLRSPTETRKHARKKTARRNISSGPPLCSTSTGQSPCVFYEPDTVRHEQTCRPAQAGSHAAAEYIAMMYSFFASCRKQGLNPVEWLKHLLDRIAQHPISRIEELLPQAKFGDKENTE